MDDVYTLVVRQAALQGKAIEDLDAITRGEMEQAAREMIVVTIMTERRVKPGGLSIAEQIAGELGVSKFEALALMRKPSVVKQVGLATRATVQLIAQHASEAVIESLDALGTLGDTAESEAVQASAHSDRIKYGIELLKMSSAGDAADKNNDSSGPITVNVNTQNNVGPLPELPAGGIRGGVI